MNLPRKTARHERGQLLVIVAVGMVVLLAMVGVVIDGGYAWGKQRATQNGTDSASEAGAVKLAENLAYTSRGYAAPNSDADVLSASTETIGRFKAVPSRITCDPIGCNTGV